MKKTTPKLKISKVTESSIKKNTKSCMCGSCKSCCCAGWGLMLLRLAIGVFFIIHGMQKFLALSVIEGFFSSFGFWPWLAIPVAAIEVLGGLALVVGIWTKWASYLLALVITVAFVKVYLLAGKAGLVVTELHVLYFTSLLVLAWNGPGVFSLHNKCGCCKDCC